MEENRLKNMVVLKNLPSNLVEEAFIILKPNQKVKNLEKIEKTQNRNNNQKTTNKKDYILKEAEMLVQSYIAKLEEKETRKKESKKKASKKYRRLKNYAYISSVIVLIQMLMLLTK